MKKIILIVFAAFFIFAAGCGEESQSTGGNQSNNSQNNNSEYSQLEEYLAEIEALAEEEEAIIDLYDSVTGDNYTDDEVMYELLGDEIIPRAREFIILVEAISPKNKELRDIHDIYIDAWNKQYSAFTLMMSAIEEQDYVTLTAANDRLDEARRLMRNFINELQEYIDKF